MTIRLFYKSDVGDCLYPNTNMHKYANTQSGEKKVQVYFCTILIVFASA